MEIIVENRTDPNERYKFYDVLFIEASSIYDGTELIKAFRIGIDKKDSFECKKFSEYKYKFYLV